MVEDALNENPPDTELAEKLCTLIDGQLGSLKTPKGDVGSAKVRDCASTGHPTQEGPPQFGFEHPIEWSCPSCEGL